MDSWTQVRSLNSQINFTIIQLKWHNATKSHNIRDHAFKFLVLYHSITHYVVTQTSSPLDNNPTIYVTMLSSLRVLYHSITYYRVTHTSSPLDYYNPLGYSINKGYPSYGWHVSYYHPRTDIKVPEPPWDGHKIAGTTPGQVCNCWNHPMTDTELQEPLQERYNCGNHAVCTLCCNCASHWMIFLMRIF